MFFEKRKKQKKCVHRYNVVDVSVISGLYGTIDVARVYVLLCNKCDKRLAVRSYDYESMYLQGLIETREEYDKRIKIHTPTYR